MSSVPERNETKSSLLSQLDDSSDSSSEKTPVPTLQSENALITTSTERSSPQPRASEPHVADSGWLSPFVDFPLQTFSDNTQQQAELEADSFQLEQNCPPTTFPASERSSDLRLMDLSFLQPAADAKNTSSSAMESQPFSFAEDGFTASDLYSDFMLVDSNIYANPSTIELASSAPSYSQQQGLGLTQDDFAMLVSDFPKIDVPGHQDQNRPTFNSAFSTGSNEGIDATASHDPQNHYQAKVLALTDALEQSRKEARVLKGEKARLMKDLDTVSKKYQDAKNTSIKIHEARKTYKSLAEEREKELREYKERNEVLAAERMAVSKTINRLTKTIRNFEEDIRMLKKKNEDLLKAPVPSHWQARLSLSDPNPPASQDQIVAEFRQLRSRADKVAEAFVNYKNETERALRHHQMELQLEVKTGSERFREDRDRKQRELANETQNGGSFEGDVTQVNSTRRSIAANYHNYGA